MAQGWPAESPPGVSLGHGTGDLLIEVRASPEVRPLYSRLIRGAVAPEGAALVAEHSRRLHGERSSSAPPGQPTPQLYAMEKHANQWRFFVVDATGAVLASPTGCAGCHQMALTDYMFGVGTEAAVEARMPAE